MFRRNLTYFLSAIFSLHVLMKHAHAELDMNGLDLGGDSPVVTPPAQPTVTAPQPPPPPEDRANKNGAAKALAIAGAAMAMAGCAKLLADAKKAREAGDEQTAAMMENMAMQQCAQGLKDMGDALKNDDAKKQLTMNDTPKMSQLQAQPFPSSTSKAKETKAPSLPEPSMEPEPTEEPFPEFVPPTAEVKPAPPKVATGNRVAAVETFVDETTTPGAIDSSKLKFDDTAKSAPSAATAATNNAVANFVATNGRQPNADELKRLIEAANHREGSGGRKGGGGAGGEGTEGGGGSGGEGGDSKEKAGGDPFEGMFGQLFGGGSQAGSPFPSFSNAGAEMVSLNKGGNAKARLNIFQFTSRQYRDITYNQGKVRARRPRTRLEATRDLSSLN